MTLDETLSMLAQQQYPHKVDVVDRVMAQVSNVKMTRRQGVKDNGSIRSIVSNSLNSMHSLSPKKTSFTLKWSAVAAAAVVALVAVNVAVFNFRSYDVDGMGSMMAQLNDYSQWNTVEQAAANPYEYLYEE